MNVGITNNINEFLKGNNIHVQLSVPKLVEKVLTRNEGVLTSTGAVRATTGKYTGRSPKDKYIVNEDSVNDKIDWGSVNQPISEIVFSRLYSKVLDYLTDRDEIFVYKGF